MFFAQILQVLSIEMFNFLAGIVEKKEEKFATQKTNYSSEELCKDA